MNRNPAIKLSLYLSIEETSDQRFHAPCVIERTMLGSLWLYYTPKTACIHRPFYISGAVTNGMLGGKIQTWITQRKQATSSNRDRLIKLDQEFRRFIDIQQYSCKASVLRDHKVAINNAKQKQHAKSSH